jgi:O-antigen/teichoic acid export membrane protein
VRGGEDLTVTGPPRRDLRDLVVRGVGWMMASQVSIQVVGLVTSIIIARFLTPRDVGLAAMGVVFVNLALLLADAGVAATIVQRPTLTEDDKSTAFWATMALGLGLTLAGIGLSWPIADFYGEPRVQPIFAALSFAYLFTAPGIVQGALLTRELKFRSLELRTIAATTASCAAGIALAVAGFGPWAIVAQHLTITLVSTILLWRSSNWRPKLRATRASFHDMAGFSSHVLGSRGFAWLARNVDNLLVGRYLGAAALGAYSLAFNLMITPVTRVAGPITQVFYPAFSRMREPERIAGAWLRAVRMVAFVVTPAMLGVIVVAPDFVRVVFGPRWDAAVPVLRILAPLGLVQALQAPNYGILQATARTRVLVRYSAVASVVTVGAFAAGLPWGIEGVATAYVLVSLVLEPAYLILTTRAVGITPWRWLASVRGVLEAGGVMFALLLLARQLLLRTDIPVGGRLALEILVGAAVYIPVVLWRAPEVKSELSAALAARRAAAEPA